MDYIISKYECEIIELNIKLKPNVKYVVEDIQNKYLTFLYNHNPICLNLKNLKSSKEVYVVSYLNNNYIFLFFKPNCKPTSYLVSHGGNNFLITCQNNLTISLNGNLLVDWEDNNLSFSHFETQKNYLLFYFLGKRNFVAIIKDKELVDCGYYDEVNVKDDEIYFMMRLKDSLNHGKVMHLSDSYESYLVYLDENDMHLKGELAFLTFMDCVLNGNYKYCKNLTTKNLDLAKKEDFMAFFLDFDYYYPIEENVVATFKKNALIGIYKFEIENGLINNIVCAF